MYNLEDALLVGGFLNTLLRQSERVRVGCLAQIVNVIAPLVTNETSVLRQTIYYPYAWALKYARGQRPRSAGGIRDVPDQGRGPAAGLRPRRRRSRTSTSSPPSTPQNGQVCLLMLNRDLASERELVLDWRDPTPDARAGLRNA